MQEFIVPLTYFTAMFKAIVCIFAVIMIYVWPRIDATTSRLNLSVFRYGGISFWLGLCMTHSFEAYRLSIAAMNGGQPPPLTAWVIFYATGGLLMASGLPVVVFTAIRWSRLRIVSPAVSKLVDRMIVEAENELKDSAHRAAADMPCESCDMDTNVGVVPKSSDRSDATRK